MMNDNDYIESNNNCCGKLILFGMMIQNETNN